MENNSSNLYGENSSEIISKIVQKPRSKKYLTIVDDDTGEVKGFFPLKSKNLGIGWFAMYQHPAEWIASLRLTGEQYSVLWFLMSRLDFDNYLRVSRAEIAERIGIKDVNVSRAMRRLKELDIITEGPPAGKFKTYRLNPYIAHKGTNRENTIIEFDRMIEDRNKIFQDVSDKDL